MMNRFVRHLEPRTSQQTVTILKGPCSFALGVLTGRLNTFNFVATDVSMAVRTTTTTAIDKALFIKGSLLAALYLTAATRSTTKLFLGFSYFIVA